MSDGLMERDQKAIGDAVGILRRAGYVVEEVDEQRPTQDGVRFTMRLHGRTRYDRFNEQVNVVKAASLEAPEIGIDGTPVEQEDDDG